MVPNKPQTNNELESPGPNREAGMPTVATESGTPAMRQYVEQKQRVGDAILLFRMGDFYETFYEDAILCAKVLGIALTSRAKGENPIPLAGIPYHALDSYLRRLVAAGYKVAISEQLEDSKLAKGVVRRDVVRIVTAGTLTDESLLEERDESTLASICIHGAAAGLAIAELAAGRLEVADVATDALLDELARLRPAELLIDEERGGAGEGLGNELRPLIGAAVTRRPTLEFSTYAAEKTLMDHFAVATLSGFGFGAMTPSLCAAGALLQYLHETQRTALRHITTIKHRIAGGHMQLDHFTSAGLEIERTLRGGQREGSLLHAIDRTVHPIGARKLRTWLRRPLVIAGDITARQDAVATLVHDEPCRQRMRQRLRAMTDVERIVARVALARASPRDLAGLCQTLAALPAVAAELSLADDPLLAEIAIDMGGLDDLADMLKRSIRSDAPLSLREGGVIADGYDNELDRLRVISRDGEGWLAEYQRKEVQRTGLPSLKVGFNRVFGYYIEVPHSGRDRIPPDYVRKQTVKNAERYITEELKRYETDALLAKDRANELEVSLFEQVRERVAACIEPLQRLADALGRLDAIAGLAELAVERRFVRPQLVADGGLEIHDGRHPVLDQTLADAFVPNDTMMSASDARVFIITGPNMAGKSTYIRQVALLTILAQIGSFVPARRMALSLVDRVFARVGSADEIMKGRSTFMVEMTEAANILHNATPQSLVVLDEIGRGTSTFDGLSLAWSITEHLALNLRCRSLVATHYHELIELGKALPSVRNCNAAVRESGGDGQDGIVFLHRIIEGGAGRSYGITVARLAGIPPQIIARSREVLQELQQGFARQRHTPRITVPKRNDEKPLPLFHDGSGIPSSQ